MFADRPVRLGYLVSHPIQYQAPLLRRIAKEPGIELKVYFMSDFSTRGYSDKGFGVTVEWDAPLTDGYKNEVLPHFSKEPYDPSIRVSRFWWPLNTGLRQRLARNAIDVLWIHGYHGYSHLSALSLAKARRIPTLVRSDTQRNGVERGRGWKGRLKDRLVSAILRLPTAFLTVGRCNADYYRSLGVSPERLFLMPYAVDNNWFRLRSHEASLHREQFRDELGLVPNRPVILFASKLQARKRALDLLEAYRLAQGRLSSDPYLIFVGDGEQRDELERNIDQQGLREGVRTLGFQNQKELPKYFDLCDVFVLPSAKEPYGLILNEVMCSSKPVIVSDEVGAAPDLVQDGRNGFVFPVGDVQSLANRIVDTLSDPAKARLMGQTSWEIIQRWDFEADLEALKNALSYVGYPVRA